MIKLQGLRSPWEFSKVGAHGDPRDVGNIKGVMLGS